MVKKISIVTPIYNDFVALEFLLEEIQNEIAKIETDYEWSVVVVDDSSLEDIKVNETLLKKCTFDLRCIKMTLNGGHQIAIANGLRYVKSQIDPDYVVIMDGDGEDDVRELGHLIEKLQDHMIVACSRLSRTEGIGFRFCYAVFKRLFRFLTGHTLNFGNFCAFNKRVLSAMAHSPTTDVSIAGTLLRIRLPICYHWVAKRDRYCGSSKMGALRLLEFAFGHLKVFSKQIVLKIFIGTGFFVLASIIATGVILFLKFSTNAPSGWTSLALLITLFAGVQAFLLGAISVLTFGGGVGARTSATTPYIEIPKETFSRKDSKA